jgi:hypothetical protein
MDSNKIETLRLAFEDAMSRQDDTEYWLARDLQVLLECDEWRNFSKVVDKAKVACGKSGQLISDHFVDVNKTIDMPKGATKDIDDIVLTRYACYLIAQNGDPRKEPIAFAQTYFAPTVTIKAKDLATEMTNFNVRKNDLQGEGSITDEHVQNNTEVRGVLTSRGIYPEALPSEEDIRKLERRVKRQDRKSLEDDRPPIAKRRSPKEGPENG